MSKEFDSKAATSALASKVKGRADGEMIFELWEVLLLRLRELHQALMNDPKPGTPGRLEFVSAIDAATRALWFSIHTLAQTYRPAFTHDLVDLVRRDLAAAVEAARAYTVDLHRKDLDADAQTKLIGHLRRSIQARADSLEGLEHAGPFADFHALGYVYPDDEAGPRAVQK